MKKTFILMVLAILCSAWKISAQDTDTRIPELYEGSIDDKLPITLYLVAIPGNCGGEPYYQAIYRYDKKGPDQWLLLEVRHNRSGRYALVEERFSGLMILQKNDNGFSGTWIHPNGVIRKKVVLRNKHLPKTDVKKYENYLDAAQRETDDC
ncbi:hypothetical protein [Chitinophaga qingshengii]|uniref:DUF3997 domain-containing protein n=1 Tax=Chitinophaga qingshengii TaxID=1569794 RepID=A0ABR7TSN9_9BACT|nr:hypothetical protein [Chitinophaga qingshengii]MBC9933496.1 hypothetical protein [Chitinophaga qingshengii]